MAPKDSKTRFPLDLSKPLMERIDLSKAIEGVDYNGFDASVLRALKLRSLSVRPSSTSDKSAPLATAVFELNVTPELCNMGGTLHGGCVGTIIDMTTSMAINACAKEGFWDRGHVSRTIACSYLRPIPAGQKAIVEVEATALGKRNGWSRGVIRAWAGEDGTKGPVCYTGEHGKVNTGIDLPKSKL